MHLWEWVHFYFFEFLSSAVIEISFSVNFPIEDLPLIINLSFKYVPTITIAVMHDDVIHTDITIITISLILPPPLLSD